MRNREWKSVRVEDALMSMKDALKQNDLSKCADCFSNLNKALEAVDINPADEAYHLSKWAQGVRAKRLQNRCQYCTPPIWRDDMRPENMSRVAPNMNEVEFFTENIYWDE